MSNSSDPNAIREATKNPVRNVAVAGLLDEQGNILLVRTKRLPNHWQPIGGGIKPRDASPAHTLQREIEEETGLALDVAGFKHAITVDYDFGEGKVHFYTCHIARSSPLRMNEAELEAWKWYSVADALALDSFPATGKFLNFLASSGS